MIALQLAVLLLVALAALAVVATRDPLRQAMVASLFGLILGILFFVLQAPDVALSQIVVGARGAAADDPAGARQGRAGRASE